MATAKIFHCLVKIYLAEVKDLTAEKFLKKLLLLPRQTRNYGVQLWSNF